MDNRPIIKRKKKVAGDGHHGGAWKVAYADFVTAMMAFFLMMWLLSSTNDQQKKGLADYFDSRIPISRASGGGSSAFKGDSLTAARNMAESGGGFSPTMQGRAATPGEQGEDVVGGAQTQADAQALQEMEDAIASVAASGGLSEEMMQHMRARMTPEGLVIDLFATTGEPLFEPGTAEPTPMAEALLSVIAGVAALVTNGVSITGHASGAIDGPEGDWMLSFDQAEMARRMMAAEGLDTARVREISGRATSAPMVEDLADPRNNRIEITFLRENSRR
ncbi:MAG: chemotaxis protein MotB [Rhodobacteraceae bacterium]|nr:MAG: chemotaxis protein MotB [Paracoccaceae bacterium]